MLSLIVLKSFSLCLSVDCIQVPLKSLGRFCLPAMKAEQALHLWTTLAENVFSAQNFIVNSSEETDADNNWDYFHFPITTGLKITHECALANSESDEVF